MNGVIERLERPGTGAAVVAVAALLVGLGYALAGNGYVLDDWYVLRDAAFGGAWAAGDNWRTVRPGGALVYAAVYGPGRHPAYALAFLTAVNAIGGVLLLVLLRRLLSARVALLVALLWIALPMRTSVEVWAAASNIGVSMVLGLGALLLLTDQRSRPAFLAGGGVLCLATGLVYESPVPALLLASVALPRLRRVDAPSRAAIAGAAGCLASLGWTLANPDPDKSRVLRLEDLPDLFRSVGGWGVVPRGRPADLLLLVFLVLVLVALARLGLSDRRPQTGIAERLVAVGLVVAFAGVAPFLLYGYVPFGFGDRANLVVSVGGALLWAGLLLLVWGWRREVAYGFAAVLAVGIVAARVERADTWGTAGQDAARIVADLPVALPDRPKVIVAGPKPIIRENVAAFLDRSNIESAAQLAFGTRDVTVRMSFSDEAFATVDPRIRYDLRTRSRLVPDMEVLPPGPQTDLGELEPG